MNRYLSFLTLAGLIVTLSAFAEETPIQYTFSGATAEENKVTLQGAGFGAYPQAAVTFGYLPTDNAFDGATDGQGAIVIAKPGEGVMIFAPPVTTTNAALIRCVARTDREHAAVTLASIGNKPDIFIAQNSPGNEAYFYGQYKRLAVSCIPPSTGFQPVIQIMNTSQTESLTAFLDNLEIYLLDPNKYYSTTFLDGDETDPPMDHISIPSNAESGVNPSGPNDMTFVVGQIPNPRDVTMEIVLIKAGSFLMGDESFSDARPVHEVTLTHDFYIGKYEVTQVQWEAVMGYNSSAFPGEKNPVVFVNMSQCQKFCNKLNEKNLGVGTFRLPTEAEWEYACRAGTTTSYYWKDGNIDDYCWNEWNSPYGTNEVGLKKPNDWGLYDMCGNAAEFCQDWYGDYSSNSQTDPMGPGTGSKNVIRGGSWALNCGGYQSAYRDSLSKDSLTNYIGFRIVLAPND